MVGVRERGRGEMVYVSERGRGEERLLTQERERRHG